MTTYTLNGASRTGFGPNETYAAVTFEFVLPDAVTFLAYTVIGTSDGLPIYDIDFSGSGESLDAPYDSRLNGVSIDPDDYEDIVVQVTEGPFAGAVVSDLFNVRADVDNIFAIRGPFPDLSTPSGLAEFESFFDSVDEESILGTPTGDFAPGQPILLADVLRIEISEDDTLRGGDAGETFDMGRGNDSVWGRGGRDEISGEGGNDRLWGDGGDDALRGGSGNDQIWGGAGNDRVWGGGGKDKLWGGDKNDKLWGDGGNDSVLGGKGKDTLWGGAGRDTLNGEKGNDLLIGGGGPDTIVFARNGGHDTVRDFADNSDTLAIDDNIVKGALTRAQVLERAEQVGDDVVITFNKATSITLEQFDLDALRNDLIIV